MLAGVHQGFLLSTLFFLIYISDLSDDLSSNPKLFANDTSHFSVAYNGSISATKRKNDLLKISY